jgi:toxin HigB-1
MINNFKHKGLEKFFLTGNTAKIKKTHAHKLSLILAKLHTSVHISDMNFPGAKLHPLKGNKKNFWSASVNGNWRVVFRLEEGQVYDVDYLDYH